MLKLVALSCVLAVVSAGIVPFVYSSVLLEPSNYRGPLSLAPGQPANILAADGRPLDTLEVNLDRSAHFTAKALDGVHILKKRSAPLFPVVKTVVVGHTPVLTHAAPITYATGPITTARFTPITYGAPLSYW